MKNKIRILLLFLIFLISGFAPINATNTEKIVVGLDINVPPMGFLDSNGNATGFDVELAKETFKSIGKEPVFQPIDWDAKELELGTGKIDVIWNGLSYSPERAQSMLLTKAYMKNRQVFIIKKDSDIRSIDDLKQKTICVQKGSSGADSLKSSDIGKAAKNIFELENMVSCLNEVRLSKSDASLVDEVTAKYYLNKNNASSEFKILDRPLSTENYVIAVKSGNESLKNQIEEGLNNTIKTNKAKEISEKWFGENIVCFENTDENTKKAANQNYENTYLALSKGLTETLKLFFVCFIFSCPLGTALAFLRNSSFRPFKFIIDSYTAIMRGTPLLLQIFFAFYGLPIIFPSLKLTDRFLIGACSFILNYTAYFTEIFRGGLKSIDKGQTEAIKALQIPKFKAIFKIILPQMFKVCLPAVCNETISLVKDTALIFSIGVVEFLTAAKNIVNKTANITAYIAVFVIYLLICLLINIIFKFTESKLKFE